MILCNPSRAGLGQAWIIGLIDEAMQNLQLPPLGNPYIFPYGYDVDPP